MNGKSTAYHSFEKIGGKFIFEANLLFPDKDSYGSIILNGNNKTVTEISYKDNFYITQEKILRNISSNVWTNLYIEADCTSKKASVLINGKVIRYLTVTTILPFPWLSTKTDTKSV